MKFGLLGEDILNSGSPFIHNGVFETYQLPDYYQLIHLKGKLKSEDCIKKLKKFDGFNVTIPYKEQIMPLLDEISDLAKKIGSVNCVKKIDNKLHGFNTDYFGFKKALSEQKIKPFKNVLVFGYGGLGKTVVYRLNEMKCNVTIAEVNGEVGTISLDEGMSRLEKFDLVINCSPDKLEINPSEYYLDCRTTAYFGSLMLKYQAYQSFYIWKDLEVFTSDKARSIYEIFRFDGTSFYRVTHTLSVMKKARELNKQYNLGIKEEDIELAAILHDYAKEKPTQDYTDIPRALVHAHYGRDLAIKEFGIKNKDILNAIINHPTGKAEMSNLEKVICLADFIEDFRTFKICKKARKLSKSSMEQALAIKFNHNYIEYHNTLSKDELAAYEKYKDFL